MFGHVIDIIVLDGFMVSVCVTVGLYTSCSVCFHDALSVCCNVFSVCVSSTA